MEMEVQQRSKFQAAIVPGIIAAVIAIVYSLILFLMDIAYDSSLQYIGYLFVAAIVYWSMISYRDKDLGGYITYGQAFTVGFFTTLISTVFSSIYNYVFVTIINPGIKDEILMKTEAQTLERYPDMSDAQLEQALSMTEMFTSPAAMTLMAIFFGLFFGAILSLIIAIFAKREDTSVA